MVVELDFDSERLLLLHVVEQHAGGAFAARNEDCVCDASSRFAETDLPFLTIDHGPPATPAYPACELCLCVHGNECFKDAASLWASEAEASCGGAIVREAELNGCGCCVCDAQQLFDASVKFVGGLRVLPPLFSGRGRGVGASVVVVLHILLAGTH